MGLITLASLFCVLQPAQAKYQHSEVSREYEASTTRGLDRASVRERQVEIIGSSVRWTTPSNASSEVRMAIAREVAGFLSTKQTPDQPNTKSLDSIYQLKQDLQKMCDSGGVREVRVDICILDLGSGCVHVIVLFNHSHAPQVPPYVRHPPELVLEASVLGRV